MSGPGFHAIGEAPFSSLLEGESDIGAIASLYFSDKGFTTEPTDALANQHFEPRVRNALRISRSLVNGSRIGGRAASQIGEIELANEDGGLDALFSSYAIDGRRVVVKAGKRGDAYADFRTVFDGTAEQWIFDESSVRIPLRDYEFLLEVPLQNSFYGGTGGADGGADLAGKPIPKCFGECLNVTPALVDPSALLYQVHDGEIVMVDAVYDQGAALTRVGSAPTIGQYSVDAAAGTFTLGGSPTGQVTADVRGSNTGGEWARSTSDIIRRILLNDVSLGVARIDLYALGLLSAANSATVGLYIGTEPVLASEVIDQLLEGVGGFRTWNRDGQVVVGVLAAADENRTVTLDTGNVMRLDRIALPPDINPPNYRRTVGYDRNFTVQDSDLAGSVTDTRRAFLREEYRKGVAVDLNVQQAHLMATDPPLVPGLFAAEADATAEAERLLALYDGNQGLFRASARTPPHAVAINDVAFAEYPRFGLSGGRYFRVVGVAEDARSGETVLEVFG